MKRPWLTSYDEHVPHSLSYPDSTLHDLLLKTATDFPNYIATSYNGVDITYQEMNRKANRFAHALIELGIKKGDRVALILPNSPTYVFAFYAITKVGAIVVNINVTSQGDELSHLLNNSGAKVAVTLDLFLKNTVNVADKTSLEHIVIHSVFQQEKEINTDDFSAELHIMDTLCQSCQSCEPDSVSDRDDVAVLQYTSGSTGTPKAVILTHKNIVSNVYQITSWNTTENRSNSAILCIIPFFHVFGMTVGLHVSITEGFRMVLYPMFDWSSVINILTDIKTYRPASFPAVPALWAALVSHTDAVQYQLSSIGVACGGGAPLPAWVQEKYRELTGKSIMQAYGLSEVSASSHITPFKGTSIIDSIGLPLPDTDVKIVDLDSGVECALGEVGEMIIRGPQVMSGYWNDPERTRETIRDGWLYTGDLAWMDKEGYFYLVDRKDDLIISNGFNVYPSDIENVLIEHDKIKGAGVIGIPDKIRGESIIAYVVLKEEGAFAKKEILEYCRAHLPEYKIPRFIRFIDEIPTNRIGKPIKKMLRNLKHVSKG